MATDKGFQIGVMATSQESTILNCESSNLRQEGAKDTKRVTSKASKLKTWTLLEHTELPRNTGLIWAALRGDSPQRILQCVVFGDRTNTENELILKLWVIKVYVESCCWHEGGLYPDKGSVIFWGSCLYWFKIFKQKWEAFVFLIIEFHYYCICKYL